MADRGHSHRPKAVFLTMVLLSHLTAGCAETRQGSPAAQDTSTTATGPNRYGAPRVSSPLDATRLLPQPCMALTAPQLRSLDLPESGVPDITSAIALDTGPSCTWRNSPAASSVAVSFLTGNKNGLADTYRLHAEGDFQGYWIETIVDTYPGVFKNFEDDRANGSCVLNVGISDTLAILVDEQDRSGVKACERAKVIATLVIKTLRGGG